MTREEFKALFQNSEDTKRAVLDGLMDEAYDCYQEIQDLKYRIRDLTERGAKFVVISKRERLLVQKRASYTNMMAKLCRELCAIDNPADNLDDLGDYE